MDLFLTTASDKLELASGVQHDMGDMQLGYGHI